MLLFIALLWCGFRYVGQTLRFGRRQPTGQLFLVWCLGAALFGHAASCIGVAYFDQSVVFLYLTLGMIVSMRNIARAKPALATRPVCQVDSVFDRSHREESLAADTV
jgi:hypothetical protein